MKKLLTVLFATLLISTTAFAQENITVEKGQYLQVGSAEENLTVNIHNEYDQLIFEDVEVENINGMANVLIPSNNPLKTIHVHIVKGENESVLKVNLTEPHKHQPHYVDAVRPTDTQAGNKSYFYCDCGKFFEDKACTKEITKPIDEWSYLAPIPREKWDGPAPYVKEIDGDNITDPQKPNPSWEQEKVEEFYEQEEIEIQKKLEERTEIEVIEPMTLSVESVKEEKELTLWEKLKMFFVNLFR